jgi:hypothetical protein
VEEPGFLACPGSRRTWVQIPPPLPFFLFMDMMGLLEFQPKMPNYTGRRATISKEKLPNGDPKWREAGESLTIMGPCFKVDGEVWVPVVFSLESKKPDCVLLDALVLI